LNRDLANSYLAGYGAGGRGAAIARPADGVFDADVTGRTPNAYGETTDGSDGACFVEPAILPDGCNNVPFRVTFDTFDNMAAYTRMWFANRARAGTNYIYIAGVARFAAGDSILGYALSHDDYNYIYVFMETISSIYPAHAAVVNADCTAHEIGHQFDLVNVNGQHPADVWCHEGAGTDYCLMSHQRDRTDVYSEFCTDHIYAVRDQTDDR
jgi:hypothetical protein